MDINELKKIVGLFDRSTATKIVLEEEGLKLSISRENKSNDNQQQPQMMAMSSFYQPPYQQQQPPATETQIQQAAATAQQAISENLHIDEGFFEIKSPIVGTFYSAPSPESDPFVDVGSRVTKGQTLCIVEAMKLMNEIESDVNGIVQKILIENAQPVEFDQVLFLVKPD